MVLWAYRQGIPEAEGLTRVEWRKKYYGGLTLQIDERREAHRELIENEGMSPGQAAEVTGSSRATAYRDVSDETGEEECTADEQGDLGAASGVHVSDETGQPSMPAGQDRADAIVADIDQQVAEQASDVDPDRPESRQDESERPNSASDPEPNEPAQPGWHKLGDHLLYCGDSTDREFIDACQGALAFADPPYNAGKADWDEGFTWEHDYLAEAADIVAVTPGIASLAGFLANTEMPYQWSVSAEITNGMTRGALGFGNWICVTLFAQGSLYRKAKDHYRIPAATGDDQGGTHPSRKPIRLLMHLIELFTSKGDTVIDPFLGSGTTLLAAQRTGRRCIGAEIDPKHCGEIIDRYNRGAASK
jgi:hypothetical protein